MEHNRPASYNTQQRRLILDYMASLGDSHVTVSQIVQYFENKGAAIGQTTIYRHLEKLAEDGKIRKYAMLEGGSACYQYIDNERDCREHFHLKCETCGKLIHINCDLLEEMGRHLLRRHRFKINALKTVFYGQCRECRSPAQHREIGK